MAVIWTEAPQEVLDLAKRIIDHYHEHLSDARIGIIMRSEAPVSGGQVTYGKARKVSAEQQVHIPYDFLIWIAKDQWVFFSPKQKEALIDHELSHLKWGGFTAGLRGHDVEEFNHILERYGAWWPSAESFETAVQGILPLPTERTGSVGTIDFGRIAKDAEAAMRAEGMDVEVTHLPATARGE